MAKFTPWFPAHVKPVRNGVYAVKFTEVEILYSKWDGVEWKTNTPSKLQAAKHKGRSFFAYQDTRFKWRGLAKNPNA